VVVKALCFQLISGERQQDEQCFSQCVPSEQAMAEVRHPAVHHGHESSADSVAMDQNR
jgi:hypothetical protein